MVSLPFIGNKNAHVKFVLVVNWDQIWSDCMSTALQTLAWLALPLGLLVCGAAGGLYMCMKRKHNKDPGTSNVLKAWMKNNISPEWLMWNLSVCRNWTVEDRNGTMEQFEKQCWTFDSLMKCLILFTDARLRDHSRSTTPGKTIQTRGTQHGQLLWFITGCQLTVHKQAVMSLL